MNEQVRHQIGLLAFLDQDASMSYYVLLAPRAKLVAFLEWAGVERANPSDTAPMRYVADDRAVFVLNHTQYESLSYLLDKPTFFDIAQAVIENADEEEDNADDGQHYDLNPEC